MLRCAVLRCATAWPGLPHCSCLAASAAGLLPFNTVSAILMCWEATGSWWRGLVPSRLRDLRAVSWHAAFWNFQGSAGFLIGGAALYATQFRQVRRAMQFERAVCHAFQASETCHALCARCTPRSTGAPCACVGPRRCRRCRWAVLLRPCCAPAAMHAVQPRRDALVHAGCCNASRLFPGIGSACAATSWALWVLARSSMAARWLTALPASQSSSAAACLCPCPRSWTQMQWISGWGNLAGAVWFELSALAMLLEQGNPQHP